MIFQRKVNRCNKTPFVKCLYAYRSAAVDVQCRRDGATVFFVAFRVRLERVLRRSADGPEPGRGQGLGAPWTPALLTRCERPGREYRVLNSRSPQRRSARGLTSQDYFGPREPVRGCETSRPRSVLAHGGHSLARAASRPPSRCAISKRSHRPRASEARTRRRRRSAGRAPLPIRSRGAAAKRDRLRSHDQCLPCMNDSDGRDRKSESCLQFLRSARNLSRCPLSGGGARGAGSVLGLAVALTKRPSELWLGAYTPCTTHT